MDKGKTILILLTTVLNFQIEAKLQLGLSPKDIGIVLHD